jgi:hypothetical protein
VDPVGTDAIVITTGWWTVKWNGHTSAIVQDAQGIWYYYYWGDSAAYLKEVPNEALESLDKFNEWLDENGAGKEGEGSGKPLQYSSNNYTTATYIEGDFSRTVSYYRLQINNVTYSTMKDGFSDNEIPKNNQFKPFMYNCMLTTYHGLKEGKLPDDTDFGEFAKFNLIGSLRPNDFRVMIRETFLNTQFTKDTAREEVQKRAKRENIRPNEFYINKGKQYAEMIGMNQ